MDDSLRNQLALAMAEFELKWPPPARAGGEIAAVESALV